MNDGPRSSSSFQPPPTPRARTYADAFDPGLSRRLHLVPRPLARNPGDPADTRSAGQTAASQTGDRRLFLLCRRPGDLPS